MCEDDHRVGKVPRYRTSVRLPCPSVVGAKVTGRRMGITKYFLNYLHFDISERGRNFSNPMK